MTSAAKPALLSKADFAAMGAIATARQENLRTMFKGTTIVADIGLSGWTARLEEFKTQGLDPIVEVAEKQVERSRITMTGFHTGKAVVADKSIKDKVSSLNYKNLEFQFNRVVRSKLPF